MLFTNRSAQLLTLLFFYFINLFAQLSGIIYNVFSQDLALCIFASVDLLVFPGPYSYIFEKLLALFSSSIWSKTLIMSLNIKMWQCPFCFWSIRFSQFFVAYFGFAHFRSHFLAFLLLSIEGKEAHIIRRMCLFFEVIVCYIIAKSMRLHMFLRL